MKVAFLQNLYKSQKIQQNISNPYFNLQLSFPDCDKVSFKSSKVFKNKTQAFDYYNEIANKVNAFLEKDDVPNALRALGYKVIINPSNGKIKINGNYKNRFDFIVENEKFFGGRRKGYFPYRDIGIDTGKIAQNISVITGKTEEYKLFDRALTHKASLVKEALDYNNYRKALALLGYKTTEDKDGNITIEGDYSSTLLSYGKNVKTLSDYGIKEARLLNRVTRINGSANFGADFLPTKYIDIKGHIFQNDPFVYDLNINRVNQELERKFLLLKPELNHKVDEVNRAFKKGDNFLALNILDIFCLRDREGKITIKQDFDFSYSSPSGVKLSFKEMGVNPENIFKNVQKIEGDLSFADHSIKSLEGIEILGTVHPFNKEHEEELFKGYLNTKDISSICGNVSSNVIKMFVDKGCLKPQYVTDSNFYFKNIEGKNKEFLDQISSNRDTILTFEELQKKFDIGPLFVENAMDKGLIKPFGVKYKSGDDIRNFMFDISDKKNYKYITSYVQKKSNGRKTHDINNSYQIYIREDNPYLKYKNIDRKACPISALKHLGYGDKADLMEACMLMTNFYSLQKHILNHDTLDITNPTIQTIILTSRKNNPAMITLNDFRKKLGEKQEEVNKAMLEGKADVMAINFYRSVSKGDYYVDLFNEKNYKYFRTVDNPEFQEFLSERLNAYNERKERNEAYLEELKKMPPLTPREQERIVQGRISEIQKRQKELAAQRRILIQRQREERIRDISLRMAIAWVLCPKTLEIKKELSNPYVQDIFARDKTALEISQELLMGEITKEEAEQKLSQLNLSDEEKIAILSYNKACWNVSGTEEWSKALKDATPLVRIYKQYGLDGIDDESVRERIVKWEEDYKTQN